MALLEYGHYRKPIVVTNVGEIPLMIKDGINGFMVESGNAHLFYESLVQLIENDSLQSNFGKELYQTVLDNFSEHNIIEQYLDWLERK